MWKNSIPLEETTHDTLLEAVVGTRQVRFGPYPSPANLKHLEGVLNHCCKKHRPIRLLSMWGCIKGYGRGPYQGADYLDFMAMRRIASMAKHVLVFHPPGIRLTIIWEDATEAVLTGVKSDEYHDSFVAMLDGLNMIGVVRVVRESSLAPPDFEEAARKLAELLLEGRADEVGWQGPVPWNHYLERSLAEFPHDTDDFRRRQVALFFGTTLVRHQRGFLPASDLKVSFCPFPASVPEPIRRGRLEFKIKQSKNSHRTAAPWSGFGVLSGADWDHVSIGEVEAGRYTVRPTRVGGCTIQALELTKT